MSLGLNLVKQLKQKAAICTKVQRPPKPNPTRPTVLNERHTTHKWLLVPDDRTTALPLTAAIWLTGLRYGYSPIHQMINSSAAGYTWRRMQCTGYEQLLRLGVQISVQH